MSLGLTFGPRVNGADVVARIDAETVEATTHVVRTVGVSVTFVSLEWGTGWKFDAPVVGVTRVSRRAVTGGYPIAD